MSLKTILEKKYCTIPFEGDWQKVFGTPENKGCWILYGQEKNGKTWFALFLLQVLSFFGKALYVSAEEGIGKTFTDSVRRAKIDTDIVNMKFCEYVRIDELDAALAKKRAPKFILIDNLTIYNDELKGVRLDKLLKKHSDKLFIFLAHEENKQPYTAAAKRAKKLAQIIIHVEGLACQVFGRCPGGTMLVDETAAKIYYGNDIKNKVYETHTH